MKEQSDCFLYWNRSTWVFRTFFTCWQWRSFRCLPEHAPGVQPSLQIWRLRAISRVYQCFTLLFFHFALTRLMREEKKKNEKSDTNNLGVVSSHSPSARQSRTGRVLGRWSVTSACLGLLTLLGSGSTLTKQAAAAAAAAGACPSHT